MKFRAILIGASALSLLAAPAAFAQHHHRDGGHAAAHRHGGSHRAQQTHARRAEARRHSNRRVVAHRRNDRHATSRRAVTRHAARNRHVEQRSVTARSVRVSGAQHWRHASRVGNRWGRGSRLPVSYWRSHRWVNWRAHRLWAPPRGYNWVEVNGSYVLLAITTGVIADIVLANSYS